VSREIPADKQVVLTRTLRHPPARVFAAWTRAEHLQGWLTPGPGTRLEATVDCREGGHLSLVFHDPDGTVNRVGGRYLVVRPPERLVFTWQWLTASAPEGDEQREVPLGAVGVETLVTVEFAAKPGGTLITITHQRFKTDVEAERHGAGWTGALVQLPEYLDTLEGEQRP
jgi:uncharacterized protein YndB with AHSA1/START domain